MAYEDGNSAADLKEFFQQLSEKPYRYELYPALRRLECLCPDQQRLGRSLHPAEDSIRLGQEVSLVFAPSMLASLISAELGKPPLLKNYSFGLLGPNGPLPLHLTEYTRDRFRNGSDPTISRFFDLFHHRLISLFYRAWADAQPTVSFDRPSEDRFAGYVDSLFGLKATALQNRDAFPDGAKRYFSGCLSSAVRNVDGLIAMIEEYFQLSATIEEFVPNWMAIPERSRCRLGVNRDSGQLGINTTLGEKVQLYQNKFRLNLGPLDWQDFQRFHRKGDGYRRLQALLRNYLGYSLSWDICLILKKEQVPMLALGGDKSELGWNTWLGHPLKSRCNQQVLLPQ